MKNLFVLIITAIILSIFVIGCSGGNGHSHKWENGAIITTATCENTGEKEMICDCGETQTGIIPKLNNCDDNKKIAKQDTAYENGRTVISRNGLEVYIYPEKFPDILLIGNNHSLEFMLKEQTDSLVVAFKIDITRSSGRTHSHNGFIPANGDEYSRFTSEYLSGYYYLLGKYAYYKFSVIPSGKNINVSFNIHNKYTGEFVDSGVTISRQAVNALEVKEIYKNKESSLLKAMLNVKEEYKDKWNVEENVSFNPILYLGHYSSSYGVKLQDALEIKVPSHINSNFKISIGYRRNGSSSKYYGTELFSTRGLETDSLEIQW
jgi:hypothetical protein